MVKWRWGVVASVIFVTLEWFLAGCFSRVVSVICRPVSHL